MDRAERADLVRLGGGPASGLWLSAAGCRPGRLGPASGSPWSSPPASASSTPSSATLLAGAVPVPLYPPVRLGRMGEYLHRTARMLAASGARLVLADPRVQRILGEAVAEAAARPRLPDARATSPRPGRSPSRSAPPARPRPGPVLLRHHGRSQAGRPEPPRHRRPGRDPERLLARHRRAPPQLRLLAAALPRHGADRLRLPGARARRHADPPRPRAVRGPAGALAARLSRATGRRSRRPPTSPTPSASPAISDAEMEGVDLSGWRTALNGAESVAPSVLRAFASASPAGASGREALTPVYGLSEAALAVTFSDLDRPFRSRPLRPRGALPGGRRPRGAGRPGDRLGRPAGPRLPPADRRRGGARAAAEGGWGGSGSRGRR